MTKRSKTTELRAEILKGRKLVKHGRKLLTFDELPSDYHKTQLMKYIELKFGAPLEDLLMNGSTRKVAVRLGINYSTISKWRKIIEEVT